MGNCLLYFKVIHATFVNNFEFKTDFVLLAELVFCTCCRLLPKECLCVYSP